jgi:anti-sigma regulatory factor (Ser/Thr protein kinase)
MMATKRWYESDRRPIRPRPRPGTSWTRCAIFTLVELPAVLDALEADLRAAGVSLKVQFAIRLSLEEAAVNALRHGHRGNASLKVRICWCTADRHWIAEVIDRGLGFDVYRVLANSTAPGRGINLMRRYLNWVRYNYLGNRVVLCKYLASGPPESQAPPGGSRHSER